MSHVIQRTLSTSEHANTCAVLTLIPEVSNVGLEAVVAVDTLCLRKDSVIGGEEEIEEELKQTGILVLLEGQQQILTWA